MSLSVPVLQPVQHCWGGSQHLRWTNKEQVTINAGAKVDLGAELILGFEDKSRASVV